MRELVYNVCCFLIAAWTIMTIAGGVMMFDQIMDLQRELQYTTDIGNAFLTNALALWLFIQATAWSVLVVPLALIAILARPAWPIQVGADVSAMDRRLQDLAERKAPTIE